MALVDDEVSRGYEDPHGLITKVDNKMQLTQQTVLNSLLTNLNLYFSKQYQYCSLLFPNVSKLLCL